MADTIEELQAQIEKLKEKNFQLLDEKKKAQTQRDELAAEMEPLEKERDHLWGEIRRITVEQPRQELFEQVAMPDMAGAFERELTHHFDIARNDDGEDVLLNKDGSPLMLGEEPAKLSADTLGKLYKDGHIKALGALMKGSGATGGGATGAGTPHGSTSTKSPEPARQFGMR
tara:strand:- start:494 stop:1009 length:516 start_codon:yes stop_codon:yes gene_type:complete